MRGAKVMVVVVLAFGGLSFLGVHLAYRSDSGAAARAPVAPPAPAYPAAPAPAPALPAAPPAPPDGEAREVPGQPSMGVVRPNPTASKVEQRVKECVLRNLRGAAVLRRRSGAEFGRARPDVKTEGREERRIRLAAIRTKCEQEAAW